MSCNKECKGLVFSGYSQVFYSNGRLEHKQGFRLLKRASCKECIDRENGIWTYLKGTINEGYRLHDKIIDNYKSYKAYVTSDGEIYFKEKV